MAAVIRGGGVDRALGAGVQHHGAEGMTERDARRRRARGRWAWRPRSARLGARLRRHRAREGPGGRELAPLGTHALLQPLRDERLRRASARCSGRRLPAADALLTGAEMAERVLEPLAASAAARAAASAPATRVIAIGRARMTRREMPAIPCARERPFRLLVDDAERRGGDRGRRRARRLGRVRPAGGGGRRRACPRAASAALDGRAHPHLGALHARLGGLAGRRRAARRPRPLGGERPGRDGARSRSAPRVTLGHALAEPAAVRRGGGRSAAGAAARDRARQRAGRATRPRS